jgi:protein involved in polysaccharide export with SLBB domain
MKQSTSRAWARVALGIVCSLGCLLLLSAAANTPSTQDVNLDTSARQNAQPSPSSNRTVSVDAPQLDASRHLLAAGDYLLVQLYDGKDQTEYRVQVDSSGNIALPVAGQVQVGGETSRDAASKLTDVYKVYYRAPYVQVQILEYGELEVFVFGTDQPGQTYKMINGSRLLDLLKQLQLTADGHYRRITLVRGGFDYDALVQHPPTAMPTLADQDTLSLPAPGAVTRRGTATLAGAAGWHNWVEERRADAGSQVWLVDPLTLTVEGKLAENNLELRDRDVIFIPAPERLVQITGVARMGYYEMLDGETLGDLLRWAGSINFNTDLANATIKRYDNHGQLTRIILNLSPALTDVDAIAKFRLDNRDQVIIANQEQRVFVLGAVNQAGVFNFADDSTVLDYIAQAGGEDEHAHMAWIAIIRQQRDRLNPLNPATVIQANFKELHEGLPLCTDISIEPGDVIYVPPKGFEFRFSDIMSSVGTVLTGFAVVDNAQNN